MTDDVAQAVSGWLTLSPSSTATARPRSLSSQTLLPLDLGPRARNTKRVSVAISHQSLRILAWLSRYIAMIGSFRKATCPIRIDAPSVPFGNFFSNLLFDYRRKQEPQLSSQKDRTTLNIIWKKNCMTVDNDRLWNCHNCRPVCESGSQVM